MFLCEKKWKMGVFCKKVENEVFFCKSGPFFNAGCIMYSNRIFYFTFYLFGGAYAPPCLYGLDCMYRCMEVVCDVTQGKCALLLAGSVQDDVFTG